MLKKILILVIFSTCLALTCAAQTKNSDNEIKAIRALLDAQNVAWNQGNLNEFMRGYWQSPKLSFYSSSGKRLGYDALLERYRKTYQADGKEMGQLAFTELEIDLLGNAAAVVRGRWDLKMSNQKKMGGLYTLILRKFKQTGWKIIHDHTSADE